MRNTDVERVHYFHADASAFGGRLRHPFPEEFPVLSPLSLPSVGGYAAARVENFRFRELISIRAAYTQVLGSYHPESKSWTTQVTSVVEGLNVNNYLLIDRLVTQISTHHSAEIGSYFPRPSLAGTQVQGVTIGGADFEVPLDLKICDCGGEDGYPTGSILEDAFFLDRVRKQYKKIGKQAQSLPGRSLGPHSKWLAGLTWDEESTPASRPDRGVVLCTLVGDIPDTLGFTVAGGSVAIPGFGAAHFAEFLVDGSSFDLTMLRLELGCPVDGVVAMSRGKANGQTIP